MDAIEAFADGIFAAHEDVLPRVAIEVEHRAIEVECPPHFSV